MKKTLVALAALASVSAFAQSSVQLIGNWDVGFKNTTAQDGTAAKKEVNGGNASTSLVALQATEDLGGGLLAQFKGQQLISTTSGQTGNSTVIYQNGNWFNDEIWAGLTSAQYGAIKLGAPNSLQHEAAQVSQPFGTAMGSGWASSGVSRFGATTTTLGVNQYLGGVSANGRVVRNEKTVRYDTPAIAGFTAAVEYAAKNDNSTTNTSNSNGFQELGLKYANGPLNVSYANTKVTAGANVASGNQTAPGTTVASALIANSSVKYNFLAANYTINALTVYAGYTTGKSTGLTTDIDTKSKNVAAKYALTPTVDLAANVVRITDNVTANAGKDQKLTGIGVDYKFSKTTSAYFRAEDYNTNKIASTPAGVKTTAVGLRIQF